MISKIQQLNIKPNNIKNSLSNQGNTNIAAQCRQSRSFSQKLKDGLINPYTAVTIANLILHMTTGAKAGATAGAAIGGPVGAAIGGVCGSIIGPLLVIRTSVYNSFSRQ